MPPMNPRCTVTATSMAPRGRRTRVSLLLALAASSWLAGCRRVPEPVAATEPAPAPERYCWWAAFRTVLPPDSVAARHARAFQQLGLSEVGWSHQADTAWAQAGPTRLAIPGRPPGTYAARVVALRRGDSTFFRPYVAVDPASPEGAATPADAGSLGARRIEFCGEIGRTAQTQGVAPREPDGEDTLSIWRRRP